MASMEGENTSREEQHPEHGYRMEENPEFEKLRGLQSKEEDTSIVKPEPGLESNPTPRDPKVEGEQQAKSEDMVGQVENMSPLSDFGLSESDLEKITGYSELSEGQKKLVAENFKQITLGRLEEEAYGSFQDLIGQQTWASKLWSNVTKEVKVSAIKKQKLEELSRSALEDHQEALQLLVDGALKNPVEVDDAGRVVYSSMLKGMEKEKLNEVELQQIEKYDELARTLASIPYEEMLNPVSKKRQREIKTLQEEFERQKNLLVALSHDQKQHVDMIEAYESARLVDQQIRLQQFFTSYPDVEKHIQNLRNEKAWAQVWRSIASERGLVFAAGFATRTVTTALLGAIAAPVASGIFGAWRGYKREKSGQLERDKAMRSGKEDTTSTAANSVQAENLTKRLDHLRQQIEKATIENDVTRLNALHERLSRRIKYTRLKIDQGLVRFGDGSSKARTVAHQMRLLDALGQALPFESGREQSLAFELEFYDPKTAISETTRKELAKVPSQRDKSIRNDHDLMEERLLGLLHKNKEKIEKVRKRELAKKAAVAGAWSAGFAATGYLIRWGGEALGWWDTPSSQTVSEGATTEHIKEPVEGSSVRPVESDTIITKGVDGLVEDRTEVKIETEVTSETGIDESTSAAIDSTETSDPAVPDESVSEEAPKVGEPVAKSEVAEVVTPAAPVQGASEAVEVVSGTAKIEAIEKGLVQINKGGTASEAAMELVAQAGEDVPISRLIQYDVKLPDGRVVDLKELELVHPGDRLEYVHGEGGENGHFVFHDESGMKYKTLSEMKGEIVEGIKGTNTMDAKDAVTPSSPSADFSHPGTEGASPSAVEAVSTAKINISYSSPALEQTAPTINEAFQKYFHTISTSDIVERAGLDEKLLREAGLDDWHYARNVDGLKQLKSELIEFVNTEAGGDLAGSLKYMAEKRPDLLKLTRLMVEYAQAEQAAGLDFGFGESLHVLEAEIENLYGSIPSVAEMQPMATEGPEIGSPEPRGQNPFESSEFQNAEQKMFELRKAVEDIKGISEFPPHIPDRDPMAVLNVFTSSNLNGVPLESKNFIFYAARSYEPAGFSQRQIDVEFKSAVDAIKSILDEEKTFGRFVSTQEVARCMDAEFTPPGDARTPRSIVFRFNKEKLIKIITK